MRSAQKFATEALPWTCYRENEYSAARRCGLQFAAPGCPTKRVLMPSGLQASSFSISDILSGPFLLNVPVYQRPYAWGSDEAGQLLDDLLDAAGIETGNAPDPDYFLGAVLLMESRPAQSPENIRLTKSMAPRSFDIVDGQQRLVTLLTLIAVLRDLEPNPKSHIARRADAVMSVRSGRGFFPTFTPRIQLSHRDQPFFIRYICAPGSTRLEPEAVAEGAEAALLEVRDHFIAQLSQYSQADRNRICDYVLDHCEVVVILSGEIDRAYRMFIVLNERGKKLQRNDILKADVISRLKPEEVDWGVKAWDQTAAELGDDFETFFSHLRTIYGHSRPQIVSAVRAVVNEEGGGAPFIRNALLPLAGTFSAIRRNSADYGDLSPRMRWYLHYLNRLADGDWAPAAMLALKDRHNNPAACERLLGEIDRMAHLLRLLCLGAGRRKKRFSDIADAIRQHGYVTATHDAFAITREETRNIAFHLRDLHKRNQKICKLLLLRLNDEISGSINRIDPDKLTIEHVLPQRPPKSSEWRQWFPSADDRAACTESLGNLVLITQSQNDKARNAFFPEKKAIFSSGHILPITRDVVASTQWGKAEIEEREARLLAVLQRIWRIDLPQARAQNTTSAQPPIKKVSAG